MRLEVHLSEDSSKGRWWVRKRLKSSTAMSNCFGAEHMLLLATVRLPHV